MLTRVYVYVYKTQVSWMLRPIQCLFVCCTYLLDRGRKNEKNPPHCGFSSHLITSHHNLPGTSTDRYLVSRPGSNNADLLTPLPLPLSSLFLVAANAETRSYSTTRMIQLVLPGGKLWTQ